MHVELMNLEPREKTVPLKLIFPHLDAQWIKNRFSRCRVKDQHQTTFNVARELASGGYEELLDVCKFWDVKYSAFAWHCHQCTPALGAVLTTLDSPVSYLECYRIREDFKSSGVIVPVPPDQEPDEKMREEFTRIGRIPYCLLETKVDEDHYYMTGKHVRVKDAAPAALLTPACYRTMNGVFQHQDDQRKSGIYVHALNIAGRVIWQKQTTKDHAPEMFASYLRMNLR